MNYFKKSILILLSLLFFNHLAIPQEIKIVTYNIRVDVPFDRENGWDNRKEAVVELLKFYQPELFGMQEVLDHQLKYILEGLGNYGYIGVGRTDGKTQGEYSPILYNKDRFELIKDSTFWLSETPESPSRGWDAAYDRVCTYGLFIDKQTEKNIWFFNSHLDNEGSVAREKGAELISSVIEKVTNANNFPIILTGDFNCEEYDTPIIIFDKQLSDSKKISISPPYGPVGTFNGFDTNDSLKRRIDFIFVSPSNIKVNKYFTIDDRYNLKYPSDHLPVLIEISIKKDD